MENINFEQLNALYFFYYKKKNVVTTLVLGRWKLRNEPRAVNMQHSAEAAVINLLKNSVTLWSSYYQNKGSQSNRRKDWVVWAVS